MKKLLCCMLVLCGAALHAQQSDLPDLTGGVYEKKVVAEFEGKSASTLYIRALEALSDWAGTDAKSKMGIDVQDKDEGMVVYKGQRYMGFKKANLLYGWDVLADFTLKVRCKDGRVQFTVQVPTMSFIWAADGTEVKAPMAEIYPEWHHKTKYLIKKAAVLYAPQVPSAFDEDLKSLEYRMRAVDAEDDF